MGKHRPKLGSSTVPKALPFRSRRVRWGRLSEAYGLQLTRHEERQLASIIRDYYRHAQLEQSAPDVAGALKRVAKIRIGAAGLLEAMLNRGGNRSKRTSAPSPSLDNLILYSQAARQAIEDHWTPAAVQFEENFEDDLRPRLGGISKWQCMEGELEMLVAACARAARELQASDGVSYRHGAAWEDFVCELTEWAEVRGYPISVSNPDSDNKPPFLAFVEKIQVEIAPQFRRYCHSAGALAQAIKRARQRRAAVRRSEGDK